MSEPEAALLTLERGQAEQLTGGTWVGPGSTVNLHGAAIDHRQVTPGCLFACFVGAQVDGHDFAATAVGDGAALVLASKQVEVPVPVLVVDDVTLALAALAGEFRRRYQGASWIAITGSNGKTTVKEMTAAACAASGPTWSTPGNYNNHLGVPLTVLRTPPDCRFVVVEMGASGPGEIAALAAIVQPDIAGIVNIGPAHLDGFGNLEGVARAKSELFQALGPKATAIFCRHHLSEVCAQHDERSEVILNIIRAAAGDRALRIIGDPGCPLDGEVDDHGVVLRTVVGEVSLRMVGAHNLANAAVAWHLASAAGADPRRALAGLAAMRPIRGRLQQRQLGEHLLLDDSYNANPGSMEAGLGVLARYPGARLAVLGGMAELGSESRRLHRGVGACAARLGLPLMTVGRLARDIGVGYVAAGGRDHQQVADCAAAVAAIRERLAVGPTTVLVKASRSAGLEGIGMALEQSLAYTTVVDEEDSRC